MKCGFTMVIAAVLLLCFTECACDKPPESLNNGLLSAEELLGTYDISYQSDTESGSRTVELRILNDRLTFAVYPDMELDSDCSFDSYDPETGEAQLQSVQQDESGEFILSCKVTFTKVDDTISVSGNYTLVRGDVVEENAAFSGEMTEKL